MKTITIFSMLLLAIASQSFSQTITLGPTNNTSTLGSADQAVPYNYKYKSRRMQFIYSASELHAAGANAGNIHSLAWYITSLCSGDLLNYTVQMKNTTATDVSIFDGNGLLTVKSAFTFPAGTMLGWRLITFDSNFYWDGTSNLLVDVCFGMNASSDTTGTVKVFDNVYNQRSVINSDVASMCGVATADANKLKPWIQFVITSFTGIEQLQNSTGDFYPDPATDYIYCKTNLLSHSLVTVSDKAGRTVQQFNADESGKYFIGNLQPGMYFISASTKNQSIRQKFIKQ